MYELAIFFLVSAIRCSLNILNEFYMMPSCKILGTETVVCTRQYCRLKNMLKCQQFFKAVKCCVSSRQCISCSF